MTLDELLADIEAKAVASANSAGLTRGRTPEDVAFNIRLDPPTALALVRMVRELREKMQEFSEIGCTSTHPEECTCCLVENQVVSMAEQALANVNRIAEDLK